MKKYKWDIYISASRLHPMEVYRGSFVMEVGLNRYFRSLGAGASLYEGGFGEDACTMNHGEYLPLPSELSIIWFSYTENKFYGGNFKLPYERLEVLFDRDYPSICTNKIDKFSKFRVGMAPGGMVVVWVGVGVANSYELARFQAQEMEVTMAEFCPTVTDMTLDEYASVFVNARPHVRENMKHLGEAKALFARYMERYNTRFVVNFENAADTLEFCEAHFANGENFYLRPSDKWMHGHNPYGSVKFLHLSWNTVGPVGDTVNYSTYIWIKKEEFLRIYREAWGEFTAKPVDFVVDVNSRYDRYDIYLTDGQRKYPFNMEYVKQIVWKGEDRHYKSSNYVHNNLRRTWDDYSD